MMQEARAREKRKQEELKVFLAASKSDTLLLLEEPNLDGVPGLTEALNRFIGIQFDPCDFSSASRFRMNDYRNHILSVLGIGARLFSDMPSLLENRRADRIWRFVTLIFMQQDGEVSLTQYGDDVLVERCRMKLTVKDKDFLERLRKLLEEKELKIDLKEDGLKRFVFRQNYGDKVEHSFNMTRQGVRWRFQHLFEIYISSLTKPSTS